MYHWEADQEDFLVVAGEALLIVEGEERPLRAWDFVHCPAGTKHVIVGAGDGPASWSRSARETARSSPDWGGYPVDAVALRHGAGVERGDDRAGRGVRARFNAPAADPLRRGLAAVRPNRSIPSAAVIPVLIYPDVRAAVAWLARGVRLPGAAEDRRGPPLADELRRRRRGDRRRPPPRPRAAADGRVDALGAGARRRRAVALRARPRRTARGS